MDGMYTSDEAANHLGISVSSLYVYVSRGLIGSHREPGSRRSYYAVEDVERLGSRTGARPSSARGIVSQIATVRPNEVRYRGEPIADLVERPFERVAELLWAVEPGGTWTHRAFPVGRRLSPVDQVRSAVVLAGSADRFRSDLRAEAVHSAARSLLAGISRTLARDAGAVAGSATGPEPVGYLVAAALGGGRPSDDLVRAVNAVMIVLADHAMMSPSTSAVRLAASTRADLYSAVLAGLGVLSGPYYGGGSGATAQLVRSAEEVGVERAVDEQLRWRGPLPGFGIPGYPNGDPRFKAVFALVERTLSAQQRNLANKLLACVARQNFPPPGIDLALALLVHATGADPTFGPAIFGLARIAGWAAHYVEELAEPVNRYLPPVVSPEGKTLPPLPRAAHEPAASARSIRRSGTSHSTATTA